MGRITIGSDISTSPEKIPVVSTFSPTNFSEPTVITNIIEVIKEVPVEIIKIEKEYIEVPVEKIVHIIKEVPTEVIKYVEREIQVIKEVPYNVEVLMERIITQEVKYVPKWAWCVMIIEFLVILFKH